MSELSEAEKRKRDADLLKSPETNEAFKILTFIVIALLLFGSVLLLYNHSEYFKIPHFEAFVGVPFAFLLALFLVLLLKQSEKKLTFSGLSFHFSGVSGEIILWVICFLSIIHAINLLWNNLPN